MPETNNKRRTDVSTLISTMAPIIALGAAFFAWYVTQNSTKAAEDTVGTHDEAPAAHYENNRDIDKRLNGHDTDMVQIKADVMATAKAVVRIEKAQDRMLKILTKTDGD